MKFLLPHGKGTRKYLRVGSFESDRSAQEKPDSQTPSNVTPRWKTTIRLGGYIVATVLLLNLTLFIYSATAPSEPPSGGFATIFRGSCSTTRTARILIDLAINICSTGLLGASTITMQVLSAPTRSDLDKAHAKGRWLDVGVLSTRNLRAIGRWRVILVLLLGASSIPLHLLYNSVVFESIGANDSLTLLVTEDRVATPNWSDSYKPWLAQQAMRSPIYSSNLQTTDDGGEPIDEHDVLTALDGILTGLEQASLQRLSADECRQDFSTSLNQDYNALVVVTNITMPNNTGVLALQWTSAAQVPFWMSANVLTFDPINGLNITTSLQQQDVLYCLAQPVPGFCSVQVAQTLLVVVLAMNLVKLCVVTYVAYVSHFQPLLTTGDAVAEYLQCPDDVTAGWGPVSMKQLHQLNPPDTRTRLNGDINQWVDGRPRRFASVSKTRWAVLLALCLAALGTGLGLVINGISISKDGMGWSESFGAISLSDQLYIVSGITASVLVANTPQLIISCIYVSYDTVITSMLGAAEFMDFARDRKGLRVAATAARGEQRSEYRLQVPLRYGLAIKVLMATLHWLVSESLFLINVDTYTVSRRMKQAAVIATVGWSLKAIVATLALGAAIAAVPFAMAWWKLPQGVPLVGSCSLAISAACHPAAGEDGAQAAVGRVMYGVLGGVTASGRRRVGFSSRDVEPLVDGEVYG